MITETITKQDYSTSITVPVTAQEAFDSINNVSGWWSQNLEGGTDKLEKEFTVHFGETNITSKVTEHVPGKKIVWLVTGGYKHWLQNKEEWHGTTMVWEITEENNAIRIDFTHIGLVPGIECYNGCENAWNGYIKGSLYELMTEGKGMPEPKAK